MNQREWNPQTVLLEWNGAPAPDQGAVEKLVREDIAVNLSRLSHPSNLAFHSVFLGGGMQGPSIAVDGMENDKGFVLTYYKKTKWVTLSGKEVDFSED